MRLQIAILLVAAGTLTAQPKPEPDVIVFTNGDRLTGHFVKSSDATLTFKSDALGDLNIDWSKVKELHTSANVAVIRKGVKVSRHENPADVPQGRLAMENQTIQLAPSGAAPQSIPVADAAVIVDQPAFQNALSGHHGFFSGWKGALTGGLTLVEATQNNRTFNTAISLSRTEPSESWMNPRNRTAFDFSETYGQISQPNTPTVKTSILHADGQRDEYFTSSLFAFGAAAFDHNFSQGLDLQQTYNGGIGWTLINTSIQTLNVKGSMSYIRQQFQTGPSQNLIGSVFGEDYTRKLPHGVALSEQASVTPAWNNTNAYSAAFATLLSMPVYKRLSGSAGIIDSYLNDPPAGFKKNSFQFTLGLTYTIQ